MKHIINTSSFKKKKDFFFSIPDLPSTSRGCSSKLPVTNNIEGWIGHALDPLGVLYDTLTEASISHDNNTTRTTGMFIFKNNKCLD